MSVQVYFQSNFPDGLRKIMQVLCNRVYSSSRSSKVVDVGTNRQRTSNFRPVTDSNLGPILQHARDTFCTFSALDIHLTSTEGAFQ